MKRILTLLAAVMLTASACRPADVPAETTAFPAPPESTDTAAAETEIPPEESGSPRAAEYRLSDFAAETVALPPCIEKVIPAKNVTKVLCETTFDGLSLAVILTDSIEFYAAVKTGDNYTAFHCIGDRSFYSLSSITLEPFTDVLGESGVRLSYLVGANASDILYFTFADGRPSPLVGCNKGDFPHGNLLIEQYGMGAQINIYRATDEGIVRTDLNAQLNEIFPDAGQMYVNYMPELFYKEYRGLFLVDVQYGDSREDWAGWLTEDAFCLLPESDMTLPEYTYTPTEPVSDDQARAWITDRFRFGTDFVLREEVDPLTLDADALKAYMDEAYLAGRGVLAVYEISSAPMLVGSRPSEAYTCAGRYYTDVQSPVFPSLSAWETYMRRILSEEMADSLMERDLFIEIDGRLYGQDTGRGTNITMTDAGSEITGVTATDITYVRHVEIREDLQTVTEVVTHEFHYTKTADGWRWTVLYIYN